MCCRHAGPEEVTPFWAAFDRQEEELVDKVLHACNEGDKYLQFNLAPNPTASPAGPGMLLYDLRHSFVSTETSHWGDRFGVIDPDATSLILIGGKDTSSAFHMDPCEARNIAFSVDEVMNASSAMAMTWCADGCVAYMT